MTFGEPCTYTRPCVDNVKFAGNTVTVLSKQKNLLFGDHNQVSRNKRNIFVACYVDLTLIFNIPQDLMVFIFRSKDL